MIQTKPACFTFSPHHDTTLVRTGNALIYSAQRDRPILCSMVVTPPYAISGRDAVQYSTVVTHRAYCCIGAPLTHFPAPVASQMLLDYRQLEL